MFIFFKIHFYFKNLHDRFGRTDVINYSRQTHDGKIYTGTVMATRLDCNGKDLAILAFKSQD